MAYIGKSYQFDKSENLNELLEHLGIPADKAEHLLNSKPSQKLEKDGDNYVLTTVDATTTEIKFEDGVEFDETITEGLVAKTTFTVEDNVVTQVQKYEDGRVLTLKRTYSDDELVVEITASTWDGTARRIYTAA